MLHLSVGKSGNARSYKRLSERHLISFFEAFSITSPIVSLWWAGRVSNPRHLRCKRSTLPLSYRPGINNLLFYFRLPLSIFRIGIPLSHMPIYVKENSGKHAHDCHENFEETVKRHFSLSITSLYLTLSG